MHSLKLHSRNRHFSRRNSTIAPLKPALFERNTLGNIVGKGKAAEMIAVVIILGETHAEIMCQGSDKQKGSTPLFREN
jgi:hypothetical protein